MSTRRAFITLLGGAAAWPLAARAQQPERMRRVAVLMSTTSDEPESQARITALAQGRALHDKWTRGWVSLLRALTGVSPQYTASPYYREAI